MTINNEQKIAIKEAMELFLKPGIIRDTHLEHKIKAKLSNVFRHFYKIECYFTYKDEPIQKPWIGFLRDNQGSKFGVYPIVYLNTKIEYVKVDITESHHTPPRYEAQDKIFEFNCKENTQLIERKNIDKIIDRLINNLEWFSAIDSNQIKVSRGGKSHNDKFNKEECENLVNKIQQTNDINEKRRYLDKLGYISSVLASFTMSINRDISGVKPQNAISKELYEKYKSFINQHINEATHNKPQLKEKPKGKMSLDDLKDLRQK